MFAPAVTVSEKIKIKICYLKKVGQGYEVEKRFLSRSNANVSMCIAEFFIILTSGNIRKRTNFTYFKHLKSKM